MTCTTHGRGFEAQVDEYVDGTLPEPARAALEAHLEVCPACRTLAADLRAIRAAARTLEPRVPPSHVWTRLAGAIESEGRPLAAGWLGAWQPILSAAAAILLVAGLWWVGNRLTPDPQVRLATTAPAGDHSDALAATYRDAEEQYATAIAGLEQITTAERATLDPDTADVLQVNLTVIDRAIVESRDALRSQPQSSLAQESLFEALRHKVALLQDTLALINEMRKGNEEGAARIISGLNQ
jgi:anti-sigma factor RsiW